MNKHTHNEEARTHLHDTYKCQVWKRIHYICGFKVITTILLCITLLNIIPYMYANLTKPRLIWLMVTSLFDAPKLRSKSQKITIICFVTDYYSSVIK